MVDNGARRFHCLSHLGISPDFLLAVGRAVYWKNSSNPGTFGTEPLNWTVHPCLCHVLSPFAKFWPILLGCQFTLLWKYNVIKKKNLNSSNRNRISNSDSSILRQNAGIFQISPHTFPLFSPRIGFPLCGDRTYATNATDGRLFLHCWQMDLLPYAMGAEDERWDHVPWVLHMGADWVVWWTEKNQFRTPVTVIDDWCPSVP